MVADGRLITPSLACGILEGTTRAWLLGWGERAGLRPDEGLFTTRHLAEADEAFACSSVAGVVPVTRFEGRPIGDGRPGSWTRRARADREACFDGPPAPDAARTNAIAHDAVASGASEAPA
jgi:branched-subunit amino acid aminotransferase/4-amino-4-deoxychorismate lyase